MSPVSAACRWYWRASGPHPEVFGALSMLGVMLPSALVSGLVGAAWGTGWWPGFGAGVVVGGLAFAAWGIFVLGTVGVLRLRGVPLERFLPDR